MILWGASDPFQPVQYGHRLCFDIPGADLWEIPQSSHFPMFDQPEEVMDRLMVFLHGREITAHATIDSRAAIDPLSR